MPTRYVLSIDGGGLYGVVPATWCHLIEQPGGVGKPIGDLFDFMVGTSTGSVLSATFTSTDNTAETAVQFYLTMGPTIFKDPRSLFSQLLFGGSKYNPKYMLDALQKYFGDKTIGQANRLLMITAVNMNTNMPAFFRSWDPATQGIRVVDAVAASSSAPTFHPMHEISGVCYIDGGLFAESPALYALVEARKRWPDDEIVLVSMGTGDYNPGWPCTKKTQNWNPLTWAKNIPTVFLEGEQNVADDLLQRLVPHLPGITHYRFDVTLQHSKHADASQQRLQAAQRLAEERAQQDDFKAMIAVLKDE